MSLGPELRRIAELVDHGSLGEAEEAAYEALAGQADLADTYELLAGIYSAQERYQLAADAFSMVLALDPERDRAATQLARSLQRLGRQSEALDALAEAIDRRPTRVALYLDAADVLRETGAFDEALAVLAEARRRCRRASADIARARIELLLAARRCAQVVTDGERFLRRHPDDVAVLDCLTAAYYLLRDLDNATLKARRLVAVAPGIQEYEMRLAGLLREAGETVSAVAALERIREHSSDEELQRVADEELQALDEAQLPVLLMMAAESSRFRRALAVDPAAAALEHGFVLSRDGMGHLLASLAEIDFGPAGEVQYH